LGAREHLDEAQLVGVLAWREVAGSGGAMAGRGGAGSSRKKIEGENGGAGQRRG
jgi:hypothetical protein